MYAGWSGKQQVKFGNEAIRDLEDMLKVGFAFAPLAIMTPARIDALRLLTSLHSVGDETAAREVLREMLAEIEQESE